MSRIGRLPIAIPAGVEVKIEEGNKVTVKGPKGTLEKCLPVEMTIKQEDNQVVVTRPNDLKKMKSLHGLTRTLVANMVTGVTKGYEKVLEINGVGYRAQKQGKITIKVIDKQKVGQYAAEIREKRKPEPYKGKGIKYADEVIRRKVGKTGKK